MNIGEAMAQAAAGRLVRRPTWHYNWHCRVLAPLDSRNKIPRLLMCEGWPYPVSWYPPELDAQDLTAQDWEVVDPAAAVSCQTPEIVSAENDDDDWCS